MNKKPAGKQCLWVAQQPDKKQGLSHLNTKFPGISIVICLSLWTGHLFAQQAGDDHAKSNNSNVFHIFDDASFGQMKIMTDDSGAYFEIDDMRYRVDEALKFSFIGVSQRRGLPWANGMFFYEFSPEVLRDSQKTEAFEQACRELLANTGLKCVNHEEKNVIGDEDYVFVVNAGYNYSYLGRQGGKQLLGINNWNNKFKITHEIKHAIGWVHEHQQVKRDGFVDIIYKNIEKGKAKNFDIQDNKNEGEYDFDSVMHYYPTDFAKNGLKSIQAKPQFIALQGLMGQRNHLSSIDLLEIQIFYGDSTVEWCGLMRKPGLKRHSGCSFVCQLEADQTIGRWVLGGTCNETKP